MSTQQKEIGGKTYSFGTLPAVDAVKVEVAIMRVIGEPLFKLVVEGGGAQDAQQVGAVAFASMTSRMDADELLRVMEMVFKRVGCDGNKSITIEHFTGKPKEKYLVLWEALRVNYADFFNGLLSASPDAEG